MRGRNGKTKRGGEGIVEQRKRGGEGIVEQRKKGRKRGNNRMKKGEKWRKEGLSEESRESNITR